MTFDNNETFFVRQAYEDGIAEGLRRAAEGGSLPGIEAPAHCVCPLCGARSTTIRNEYLWALERFAKAALAEDALFAIPSIRKINEVYAESLEKLREVMNADDSFG